MINKESLLDWYEMQQAFYAQNYFGMSFELASEIFETVGSDLVQFIPELRAELNELENEISVFSYEDREEDYNDYEVNAIKTYNAINALIAFSKRSVQTYHAY